ncbi:MAG: hypothetical protein ACYDER_25495 [Ktedonobacteraceae bacterium]
MVPLEYFTFFMTAAGAGAALIGLLLVAVSLAPQRTVQPGAPVVARVISSSTFTALFVGFFISLGAILPHFNIGVITLVLSLVGVMNSLSQAWLMLRPWPAWQNVVRRMWLTALSLYLYIQTLVCAIQILIAPNQGYLVYYVGELLLGIYGIALLRAWELLGVQRTGLLAWLNPLYEESTNTSKPVAHTDQSDA